MISKLVLFFSLVNIEDLHMVQGYNYAYLFRFFLGRKTYLSRQKSFFNLGNELILLIFVVILKVNLFMMNYFF